uniref:Small ribosomal subunit protein bS18c n=2 Tax=Ignatiaceae TaxID=2682551 RepID=A0A1W6EGU1_9CHLO|nr:ribosomal protein S18 [Pseudocharacium americanum]YP_009367677.1 ribosomal protein S18 [Ignatius tetrasporus]ARK14609.1 ribosomal protein S18 [Pseudocharacium americanum]ARK14698.1 ribosomal protein S18 [Ignatius tetrasporus]
MKKIRSFKSKRTSKNNGLIPIIRRKSNSQNSSFQGTIDYKNVVLLRKYISIEGKILPRRVTGLSAKQQRYITKAIKNARMVGLLPFVNQ